MQTTVDQLTTSKPPIKPELSADALEAFGAAIKGSPTPVQCLKVISNLFPKRLIVTDSAWRSAENSDKFRHGEKALHLLLALATDYWSALSSGQSDAVARKYLGGAYAATESETVEMNKRARKARTFQYQGKAITVAKHLKIGIKDSVAETLRIYFEWEQQEKAILIFHCGPHPPHN